MNGSPILPPVAGASSRARQELAQLRARVDAIGEHLPTIHRLVLAGVAQNLFSLLGELIGELEQLKKNGPRPGSGG